MPHTLILFLALVLTLDGNSNIWADEEPDGSRGLPIKKEATDPIERIRKRLRRLDANEDQVLEKSEVPSPMQPLFAKILEAADKNADGSLSLKEFEQAKNEIDKIVKKAHRPSPERMFARFDTNKDGKVTKGEVPEDRKKRFNKLLQTADTDGDGELSREEFLQGMAKFSQRVRHGRVHFAVMRVLDSSKDGELSVEEIAAAPSSLRELDRDGDGRISRAELGTRHWAETRGGLERFVGHLLRQLEKLDTNQDKRISREEAEGLPQLEVHFGVLDADGDGLIGPEELKKHAAEKFKEMRKKHERPGDHGAEPKDEQGED